jgi:hypothetical protein
MPWHQLKSLFFKALTIQAAVVAGVAVYLGAILFPGALTQTGRERVMTLMADGYAVAKWLDATLPPDAIVLEDFRSRALLPRPFIVGDRWRFRNAPNWKQQLTEFVKEKRVTVLVTRYPINRPQYSWLATHYGATLAGPTTFRSAARSPFNRGSLTAWIVMRLNVDVSASQVE